MDSRLVIAAADIGSVKKDRFDWALLDLNSRAVTTGSRIVEFADAVVESLNAGRPLALGFECPLFVPVRHDPNELTSARVGEGNRAWSAASGAGSLATGLAEVAWTLREMRVRAKTKPILAFRWEEFVSGGGVFVWEAFVSGTAKSNSHTGDAERAVCAFDRSLPDPPSANCIKEPTVISLVGAAALWARWTPDPSIVREPSLVIASDVPA